MDVKANIKKKLNVMKKIIFTLFALVAIVGISNKTFAQASTARAPYAGNEYTYQWNNVTCNTHTFTVTTSTTGPTTDQEAASGTTYTIETAATTGALSNAAASIGINWAADNAGNTRYVWLTVNSADGCSNYKRVTVVIKSLDLIIADITTTYTSGGWTTAGASDVNSCPDDLVNPDTDNYDAGTTTIYFRVTRTEDGTNALASDDDWQFDLAVVDDNADAWGSYTIVVTDGAANTITASGSTYAITANTSYALVAVTFANEFEDTDAINETAFTASISNGKSGGFDEVSPKTTNLNSADHSIKSTPSIGDFAG